MVIHNSNRGAVLNSCALALAGYDGSTPDPAGGVIGIQQRQLEA